MRFGLVVFIVLASAACVWADPQPLPKPVAIHIIIRSASKTTQGLSGQATACDDNSLVLQTPAGKCTFLWTELTSASAFENRSQLMDRKDPQAWLKLGVLMWGMDDQAHAKAAMANVVRLAPEIQKDVDSVMATEPGALLKPGASNELLRNVTPGAASTGTQVTRLGGAAPQKITKPTTQESEDAIAQIRADAKQLNETRQLGLQEVETDHFLIYTDWDPREYDFLKDNAEAAYAAVARQFNLSPRDNVFIGKLEIIMLAKHEDFLSFAKDVDHVPAKDGLQGYYQWRQHGLPHMVMSKPLAAYGTGPAAEKFWAYVLTHEFTHAFVVRYRTTGRVPTWLNEGIAEVIASSLFPRDVKAEAASMSHNSIKPLFDESAGMQDASMYPVMRTLTEVLILRDRAKFIEFFDEIKDGSKAADALQKVYGWTFDDLTGYWTKYVNSK